MGGPHPSKINSWLRAWWKYWCDLPFQPQSFWKRRVVAGWKIVQSTASQWNRPFFFSCFCFVFFFFFFFFFFCLFVCLFDWFFWSPGTGLKLVSERTAKVNKMKNKYLCWIVDNYAVCLSVIFIWNLFEVVGKVHVGPLILNFLFVCFFVLFCSFVLFCFVLFWDRFNPKLPVRSTGFC